MLASTSKHRRHIMADVPPGQYLCVGIICAVQKQPSSSLSCEFMLHGGTAAEAAAATAAAHSSRNVCVTCSHIHTYTYALARLHVWLCVCVCVFGGPVFRNERTYTHMACMPSSRSMNGRQNASVCVYMFLCTSETLNHSRQRRAMYSMCTVFVFCVCARAYTRKVLNNTHAIAHMSIQCACVLWACAEVSWKTRARFRMRLRLRLLEQSVQTREQHAIQSVNGFRVPYDLSAGHMLEANIFSSQWHAINVQAQQMQHH